MCTTVMIMKAGRIERSGSPRQLIEQTGRSTLEEVFLDIVRECAAQ
jgi:ABC-type Na+ transport system ATPase subunit NatA